jgi:hypothetical protein
MTIDQNSTSEPRFRFLFGMPVRPAHHSGTGRNRVFILGAYPSALHIRWISPDPGISISAVAVDNEPEPFWNGDDEQERIHAWKEKASWQAAWGEALPCGHLNGSSGEWVEDNVLRPLSIDRDEVWITDCLDTYRISEKAAARLAEPEVLGLIQRFSIPPAVLPSHPSEGGIVGEALGRHRDRLLRELREASPELVITLGNAALRVITGLATSIASDCPGKLSSDLSRYGKAYPIRIADSRSMSLLPLAHPAAPPDYQDTHCRWVQTTRSH